MTAVPRVPGEDLGWATPIAAFAIGCACAGTAVALVNAPPPLSHGPPPAPATATATLAATSTPSASAGPPSDGRAPASTASASAAAPVCAPLAIVFEYARENVPSLQMERLDGVARWLGEHPEATVVLQGHADARGSEDENLQLSKRRARNVANALAARGIDRLRVTAGGFGSYQPIEGVPEEDAANRRVVVFIKGTAACPSFVEKGKEK
ncbi:MAG: OmpA family protein [Myxococcales bacterium]|nr:OmpA family protein [Myxococcales bacterium]